MPEDTTDTFGEPIVTAFDEMRRRIRSIDSQVKYEQSEQQRLYDEITGSRATVESLAIIRVGYVAALEAADEPAP